MELLKPVNLHLKFLKLCGLWFSSENLRFRRKFLAFHLLFFILTAVPLLYEVFTPKALKEKIKYLNFFVGVSAVFTKILILLLKHDEIKNLIEEINSNAFQPNTESEIKLLKKRSRKWIRWTVFFFFTLFATVSSQIALWFGPKFSTQLPLYDWFYGLNWQENGWIHRCIYVHNTVIVVFFPTIHFTFNTLINFIINFTNNQMELVCHRLANLKGKLYMVKFKRIIQHQQNIIELQKKIKNIFAKVIFIQLSMTAFIICFIGYQMSSVRFFFKKIAKF